MPNEDEIDIPAGWSDVVHPRRHGMIAVEPRVRPSLRLSLQRIDELVAERGLAQTITELTFESSAGDLGVFSDLPLVTARNWSGHCALSAEIIDARRGSLAVSTRPGDVINSNANTEHAVMTGPAIDAAVIVADLHPLPGLVNGRHQVQVDRPGDTRKDDIANFEFGRIYRRDDDPLPTADQGNHRRTAGPQLHRRASGHPARRRIQHPHSA